MAEEGGSNSRFNAAVAQMERIDSLQRAMNAARFNRFLVNEETMTYNYQVTISSIKGLYQEISKKLTDKEIKEFKSKLKKVEYLLEKYPPIIAINKGRDNQVQVAVDSVASKLFESELDELEELIRNLADSHGYNSPDDDDDEGL